MPVMISINPPYSNMIFDGTKPFEFRNQLIQAVVPGAAVYVYETKNKHGLGCVIGEAKVDNIYRLHYHDSALENERAVTAQKYNTQQIFEERYRCIKDIYLFWCLSHNWKPNMNEGWFRSERFSKYRDDIGHHCDCNYALYLTDIKRFHEPMPLSSFHNAKGETIRRPPQNMFRASMK